MLAVIPCKLGSKRVPFKNLSIVGGVTLVQRAYGFARYMGMDVVITTEHSDGLSGYMSGNIISSDAHYRAMDEQNRALHVWREALGDWDGITAYFEPSSPMRRSVDVEACLAALKNDNIVMTAHPIKHIVPGRTPEQGLTPNGACYLAHASTLRRAESLWSNMTVVETGYRINIDTREDLALASLVFMQVVPDPFSCVTVPVH